ncbi:MAG: serine/threonine protein kinase [Burkholderiaceae bacterium]|mgnify:FL=1|nr:serine/threonine protein kinase [Burkholderiaceae bacterium]MCD6674455.1 serine/threonine protein kinase [Burkholderiaceae bacterium]
MATQTNAPLPEGLEVGGYRIVRKISSGGFSIVYLAEDESGVQYAIKEYLPSSLVQRAAGELEPRVAEASEPTFLNGLRCFFEEGRALARIFHPNVVRVVNFFRANGTVYLVMAYERGRSLQELVLRHRGRHHGRTLAERHLLRVFHLAMNGLREVHANRLLHLDLKPANVYLRLDGTPLLLDFGAARRALDVQPHKLFPMYTPGFAAPELYRRNQQLGPWTDVYGIGASLFGCMAGQPPQPADQRELDDKVPAALDAMEHAYSRALLDLVGWCLKLDALERPQSVFALQRAMRHIEPPPEDAPRAPSTVGRWIDTLANRVPARRRGSESVGSIG